MIPDRTAPRREEEPTVFVVDDEASVRSSLQWLLESIRLRVETFDSAEAVLARVVTDRQVIRAAA